MAKMDNEQEGLGKDTFTDSIDIELGGLLSRAGGFGLANELSRAIARRSATGADASPSRCATTAILRTLASGSNSRSAPLVWQRMTLRRWRPRHG